MTVSISRKTEQSRTVGLSSGSKFCDRLGASSPASFFGLSGFSGPLVRYRKIDLALKDVDASDKNAQLIPYGEAPPGLAPDQPALCGIVGIKIVRERRHVNEPGDQNV